MKRFQFDELAPYVDNLPSRYFPQPHLLGDLADPEDNEYVTDIHLRLSLFEYENLNKEVIIQESWKKIYERAVAHIAKITIGRKEHFLIRFVPQILQNQQDEVILRLNHEIMLAPTGKITIPVFSYSKEGLPIEWRCDHCHSPNEMDERFCSQCGAPRALLIQEMEK